MGCGPEVAGSVYHPRQPQQTPFDQLVERFYPQFEAVYPERYQDRSGWCPDGTTRRGARIGFGQNPSGQLDLVVLRPESSELGPQAHFWEAEGMILD